MTIVYLVPVSSREYTILQGLIGPEGRHVNPRGSALNHIDHCCRKCGTTDCSSGDIGGVGGGTLIDQWWPTDSLTPAWTGFNGKVYGMGQRYIGQLSKSLLDKD